MKGTDILILFLMCLEMTETFNLGTEVPVTGGMSKGSRCGGSDCSSLLSLKALFSHVCLYTWHAWNDATVIVSYGYTTKL